MALEGINTSYVPVELAGTEDLLRVQRDEEDGYLAVIAMRKQGIDPDSEDI